MSLKNKLINCLLAVINELEELTLKPIVDEPVVIVNPIVVDEPIPDIVVEEPIPDIMVEEPITKEPLNEKYIGHLAQKILREHEVLSKTMTRDKKNDICRRTKLISNDLISLNNNKNWKPSISKLIRELEATLNIRWHVDWSENTILNSNDYFVYDRRNYVKDDDG
jgi:hypothetical protein